MDVINKRYLIEKTLEIDSESRTFEVFDKKNNKKRMLRLFDKGLIEDKTSIIFEDFLRFTKSHHKNILSNYNLDVMRGHKNGELQYFYTKEYIDNTKLLNYVDLTYKERIFVLESILYAISYLHFKGIVYGTLSFSNIFISRNSDSSLSVKLQDLATAIIDKKSRNFAKKESIFYVSGIESYNLSKKADIFSLGVITYYLLTGEDYHKKKIDYEGLKSLGEKTSKLLSESIHIDPDKRPKSVLEFWKKLARFLNINHEFTDKKYYEYLDFSSSFVVHKKKRDEILSCIREYFAGERRKKAFLIRSKTGMGKSRFLSEIKHFSRMNGFYTFHIEACDIVSDKYHHFKLILEQILASFDVPNSLLEKYGEDLVHLVPKYEYIWDVKPSVVENEGVLKNRIISRFFSLVQTLSADYQFIIMIDNVDKLSEEEIEILVPIINSREHRGPYLVLSASDMPPLLNEKGIKNKYYCMELKPFNYYDTVYYIKKLLNIGEESKAIGKSISGICHGNPRKIENIVLFMHKIGRIRVSKQRTWKIKDSDFNLKSEDLENLDLHDLDLNLFDSKLSILSSDATFILKQLAIFSQQVDVFFALQLSGLGGKRFMAAVDELIKVMIIQKTTSDWGNYYEFSDYRYSNIIYHKIDVDERTALHKEIAKFYEEKDFDNYEAEFDSYVFHLIKSNQNDLAIKLLEDKADSKSKSLLYKQSIEYYEYALSIINTKDMPREYLNILNSISMVYYRLGKLKSAENYFIKLIALSEKFENNDLRFKSYESIIELCIFQNRMEEAKSLISKLEPELENYGNEMIRIKFEYLVVKLYLKNKEDENFIERSEKFIEYLRLISNDYYLSLIVIAQAYYLIEKGDYDEALEKLYYSLEMLKKKNKKKGMIIAYRLLGSIYLKQYAVDKSEEYLMQSYKLAKEIGMLWENARLLIDIGDLNLVKKDYERAKMYYQRAEKYSSFSNEIATLMLSSISLAKVGLLLNEQATCKMQLDKYADLFEENKESNLRIYYYENLLVKATMFIEHRNIEIGRKLLSEIEDNFFTELHPIKQMRVKLLRILCNYFDSLNRQMGFDFVELDKVISGVAFKGQKIMAKEFLLDLALDAYVNAKMDVFNYAFNKSKEIESIYQSISIYYRMDFCQDLIDGDLNKLLSYIEDVKYNQFAYSWKIYCIIADIQFKNGEYVNALVNYIEARGQFLERIQAVPAEYRTYRILKDSSYHIICNRLDYLSEKLYDLNLRCDDSENEIVYDISETYDVTIKKLITKIIRDKEYKKYIKKIYEKKYDTFVENWQKYIVSIDEDNRLNLEKLIKFLVEHSLAQYGCLFIVSEDGEFVESFSTDLNHETSVIDYISSIGGKGEVYIENKNWDLSLGYYGGLEKTKMFFPIYLREKSNLYTRRLSDENLQYNELVGYVYLESDRVIHNISLKTYKNIKSYEPLISLLINDYNISKEVTVDNLTQTHVRSYVQSMVQKTIKRSMGGKLEFSVLMLDIDHFKDVNDTYGHTRGDQVLRDLADILKSNVRESDIVGRYGGEEFVIILNGLNRQALKRVAEKIRVSVDNAKLLGDKRPLTISIGAASYPKDGKNLDVLIENADKALYRSKNNGRNMVTIYNSDIAVSSLRYDSLAGVLGISTTEDDRRINSIVEIINVMSKADSKESLLTEIFSRIMDIVEVRELCVVLSDGRIYSKRTDIEGISTESLIRTDKLKEIVNGDDGYFIDWNDNCYSEAVEKIANWNTYIVSSLVLEGNRCGKLILHSSIKEHEFEKNHYKFVSTLSPLVATIIKDM